MKKNSAEFLPGRSSFVFHLSLDLVRCSRELPPPRRVCPPRDVHDAEPFEGVVGSSFCSVFSSSSPRDRRHVSDVSDVCRVPLPRRNDD